MIKIQIQKIAKEIRKKFEQKKVSKKKLEKLYSEYNNKVNGNIFVTKAEKLFPKLNCGLASLCLKEIIGGEIICGKYQNYKHTFLLLDNWVVDITADQYGGPKVYVGKLKPPWAKNK